jgi:hypothetical protein
MGLRWIYVALHGWENAAGAENLGRGELRARDFLREIEGQGLAVVHE